MKIQVVQNSSNDEVVLEIHCKEVNNEVESLIELINSHHLTIQGKDENGTIVLSIKNIYYFEAVDNRVFAYLKENVFEVDYKIAELNELLANTSFIQISRTVILNIVNVNRIKTLVNGRMMVELNNGEKQIITRLYAKTFKDKLKGGK